MATWLIRLSSAQTIREDSCQAISLTFSRMILFKAYCKYIFEDELDGNVNVNSFLFTFKAKSWPTIYWSLSRKSTRRRNDSCDSVVWESTAVSQILVSWRFYDSHEIFFAQIDCRYKLWGNNKNAGSYTIIIAYWNI